MELHSTENCLQTLPAMQRVFLIVNAKRRPKVVNVAAEGALIVKCCICNSPNIAELHCMHVVLEQSNNVIM